MDKHRRAALGAPGGSGGGGTPAGVGDGHPGDVIPAEADGAAGGPGGADGNSNTGIKQTQGGRSFADTFEATLKEIIKSEDSPAEVIPLWGYPVQDTNRGLLYLYLNLQFTEYVVINVGKSGANSADVAHRQDLSSESSPLAGSIVWVRSSARMRYVRVTNAAQVAGMLQGQIQQAMQGRGASALPLMGASGTPGAGFGEAGSYGGCGTGNITPGCPYYPATQDPRDYNCTH